MKIKRVEFENFKSYVRKTEFDFSDKNHINILWGENGNGKTSFLEGISLAFFGSTIFNSDSFTQKYVQFVCSRLSKNASSPYITLAVDYEDENEEYHLKRIYTIHKGKIDHEEFVLNKDGKEVAQSPFLKKYTYDVMEKFFVDGEKIIELINQGKENQFIQEFVNVAFNMTVFKQIKGDIEKMDEDQKKTLQTKEHQMVEKDVLSLEKRLSIMEKRLTSKEEELEALITQERIERKSLDKKGIEIGNKLQELMTSYDTLSEEIQGIQNELKEFMLQDVHHLLHKPILKEMVTQLNKTRKNRLKEIEKFYGEIKSNPDVELPESYLSLDLERKIMSQQKIVRDEIKDRIEDLVGQLTTKKKNQTRSRTKITNSKEGQAQLDDVHALERLIGVIEKEKAEILKLHLEQEDLVNQLRLKQEELEKHNEWILAQQIQDNFTLEKIKLTKVVNKYIAQKTEMIYQRIGERSLEILKNHILRKKSLMDEIRFNQGFLEVSKDDEVVDYRNFSAGEKQMLIVGILFAILDLANLHLPLVLDSFVGRLDLKHTHNIIEYLKGQLDTQIVLLSTDSEVNDTHIKKLQDKLGNCYLLDNDGFSTGIKEIDYEN